jgi:hypothetical protein
MMGIYDVFPPDSEDINDPISEKKLKQNEGLYSTCKTLLGFDFDGNAKTIWLKSAKCEKLLTILKGWILTGHYSTAVVNFAEFKSTIAKLCHTSTCIRTVVTLKLGPEGKACICLSPLESYRTHCTQRMSHPPPQIH